MIKSAEGCAGLLHKITQPSAWGGGCNVDGSAVWRKRAEYGGQAMENEELKALEEALPRLNGCELEKASGLYKAKTGVSCDGSTQKFPSV